MQFSGYPSFNKVREISIVSFTSSAVREWNITRKYFFFILVDSFYNAQILLLLRDLILENLLYGTRKLYNSYALLLRIKQSS